MTASYLGSLARVRDDDLQPQSKIANYSEACASSLAKLNALVAEFEGRLCPVLRPREEEPTAEAEQALSESASPLANELARHVDTIGRVTRRLSALVSALEI